MSAGDEYRGTMPRAEFDAFVAMSKSRLAETADPDSVWVRTHIAGHLPAGVEIRWGKTVPAPFRAVLERYIPALAPIIPTWCHVIRIVYDPSDADGQMTVSADDEYRMATITILPNCLQRSPDELGADLAHEFVHLPLEPMCAVFHTLCSMMKKEGVDKEMIKFAKQQHRRALEGAVSDLTRLIHPLLVDNATR